MTYQMWAFEFESRSLPLSASCLLFPSSDWFTFYTFKKIIFPYCNYTHVFICTWPLEYDHVVKFNLINLSWLTIFQGLVHSHQSKQIRAKRRQKVSLIIFLLLYTVLGLLCNLSLVMLQLLLPCKLQLSFVQPQNYQHQWFNTL